MPREWAAGLARATTRPAAQDDIPRIVELLEEAGLPTAGLNEEFARNVAVLDDKAGRIAGCAGVEVYGNVGLLRSVAIRPDLRGAGSGRALVEDRIRWARAVPLDWLYLLTTTADPFFERLGFSKVDRVHVAPAVQRSAEFRELCPSTAVAMRLRLRD